MTEIEIRPFEKLEFTPVYGGEYNNINAVNTYAGYVGDEQVFICGMLILGDVGEIWLAISERAKTLVALLKTIKGLLDREIKKHNIRRIQSIVDADEEDSNRLVEHLGMKYEGTMIEGRPGIDYNIYGRIV